MILSACVTTIQATPTERESLDITLEVYKTATPTIAQPTQVLAPRKTVAPPVPTATPMLYSIVKDDTLLGIALRFGISVEDLLAANPGIDPGFLTIGMTLTVPTGETGIQVIPTATALPLGITQPLCYLQNAGGVWCILTIQNELSMPVENASALVAIFSEEEELTISQIAYASLNLLHPGERMPLLAYFADPLPEKFISQADLFSALPALNYQERYVAVSTDLLEMTIRQAGGLVDLSGTVIVTEPERSASQVWVVAIAYDEQDQIVGVRKLEFMQQIQPGEKIEFDTEIFSLGPQIVSVQLMAEARP